MRAFQDFFFDLRATNNAAATPIPSRGSTSGDGMTLANAGAEISASNEIATILDIFFSLYL
jgi:hypothetical protein